MMTLIHVCQSISQPISQPIKHRFSLLRMIKLGSSFSLLLPILVACSGGSGESTSIAPTGGDSIPGNNVAGQVSYNGPDPRDQAVRDFQFFFWNNVTDEAIGCANCHMQDGVGTVKFVRNDDINLAFDTALSVVDLVDPGNSAVVNRVFNNHNCWSPDPAICRDTLTAWVSNWAAGVEDTSSTSVALAAPLAQMATGAILFPENSSLFETTVYPLLTENCASCHSDSAPVQVRQTPLFAHSNVDTAYEAAKTKIDLSNTRDSRLVVRLRDESHNCWDDCATDAVEMQTEIEALLPDNISPVDPDLIKSLALRLDSDGIPASSGGRVETHVIAQYEFRIGSGTVVADRSMVEPFMPLTLIDGVEWLDNWGLQFTDGRAQASVNDSRKLYDELTATREYSIEAWVFPANVTQENSARIVSYSSGANERNFTLGQSLYNYDYFNRSGNTDNNGEPLLSTNTDDQDLQEALQHVVVTFDEENGRQIYVDGQHTGDVDPEAGAGIASWDEDFAFVIGNEVSGNRSWEGAVRFVAIHRRALSQQDIQTNFDVGVGQKYFMLFRLGYLSDHDGDPNTPDEVQELTPIDDSYVVFQVSQYDNYSYLFSNPYFLALNADTISQNFVIKGLRVGVNGKVSTVGQVFTTLDMQVEPAGYSGESGYPISSQGMIVSLENGADLDQFFLSFEQLDVNMNVFVEADFDAPIFSGSGLENSDVALRNFSEMRETFAQITAIDSSNSAVSATYDLVIQQLPSNENILGFLSAHQMGVTQLAIAYCNQLVETKSARDALGISLDEVDDPNIDDANGKTVADWDTDFIDPLITRALNSNLTVQPDFTVVKSQLHHLLFTDADGIAEIDAVNNPVPDGLSRCAGGCVDGTTALAAKAACAAVLGSSAVSLQ